MLRDKILDVLKRVEAGNFDIEIIKKTKMIPMVILFEKTGNPPLEEMKKVLNELKEEREIIVCVDPRLAKISKFLNHPNPSIDLLFQEPTEDELFIFSDICKLPKDCVEIWDRYIKEHEKNELSRS